MSMQSRLPDNPPDELPRELIDLARSGNLAAIPTHERPFNQAQAALDDLRAGRVVGRTVLSV